jgi:hypothetical protein
MLLWWRRTGVWLLLLIVGLMVSQQLFQHFYVRPVMRPAVNLVGIHNLVHSLLPTVCWALAITQVEQAWQRLTAHSPISNTMLAARYRYMLFQLVPFCGLLFAAKLLLNLQLQKDTRFLDGSPLPYGYPLGNAAMVAFIPLGLIALMAAIFVVSPLGVRLGWLLLSATIVGSFVSMALNHFFPQRQIGKTSTAFVSPELVWLISLFLLLSLVAALRLHLKPVAISIFSLVLLSRLLFAPVSTLDRHFHSSGSSLSSALMSFITAGLHSPPFQGGQLLGNWLVNEGPSPGTILWWPAAVLYALYYPIYLGLFSVLLYACLSLLERYEGRLRGWGRSKD